MMNNMNSPGYLGVKRLAIEKPEWLPIVESVVMCAKRLNSTELAGSWVLNEAIRRGITWKGKKWFPGLRTLAAYGILKKVGTARGGRRAYYIIPDMEGIEKALQELKSKEIYEKS